MIIVRAVKRVAMRLHTALGQGISDISEGRPAASFGPQDLEHLALAAYMLGRSDDHFEYLKRAHRAYQNARDLLRARMRSGPESILRRADSPVMRPAGSDAPSVSPIADRATT